MVLGLGSAGGEGHEHGRCVPTETWLMAARLDGPEPAIEAFTKAGFTHLRAHLLPAPAAPPLISRAHLCQGHYCARTWTGRSSTGATR